MFSFIFMIRTTQKQHRNQCATKIYQKINRPSKQKYTVNPHEDKVRVRSPKTRPECLLENSSGLIHHCTENIQRFSGLAAHSNISTPSTNKQPSIRLKYHASPTLLLLMRSCHSVFRQTFYQKVRQTCRIMWSPTNISEPSTASHPEVHTVLHTADCRWSHG